MRRSPNLRLAGTSTWFGAAILWLVCGHASAAGQARPPAAQTKTQPPAAQSQAPPPAAHDQESAEPSRSATVPFILDHNRMIVEVEFLRPDGTIRKARAWVDTGNQYLMMAEPLARDLGLDVSGLKSGERSVELTSTTPLMRLGGLPLHAEGVKMRALPGARTMPGEPAEASLPATVLRHDHVVFDYPARLLTIARPGVLEPKGVAIPCRVNNETGLFLIAATVDGDTVQLGVDNGSAGMWVSDSLTTRWTTRHPDWPRAAGAAGSANFFGFPFESAGVLMCLPDVEIGNLRAEGIGLLGLDQSVFDWYSTKSAGPVLGFIGANVLRSFRVEIDLPNQMTYWEAGPSNEPRDLDIVGLTLRPEADGSFTVASVVTKDGKPAVEGVQTGDKLIRVDELDTANATMGAVADALRGTPGSTHTLVIERAGERITLEAKVLRLP